MKDKVGVQCLTRRRRRGRCGGQPPLRARVKHSIEQYWDLGSAAIGSKRTKSREQGLNIPLGETLLSGAPTEFEHLGDVQKLEKNIGILDPAEFLTPRPSESLTNNKVNRDHFSWNAPTKNLTPDNYGFANGTCVLMSLI